MEPRIQYATTSDGVSIAYYAMGEGPPLVVPPSLAASHLQLERDMRWRWQVSERFAERATVVRYDPRGAGMSQRGVIDFSPSAMRKDLEGVVDHLRLDRFAIFYRWQAGDAPVAYSADHPERVSHLVLWSTRSAQEEQGRLFGLASPLIDQDWVLFTNIQARLVVGWDSEDATPLAALFRASHTPDSFRAALEAMQSGSAALFADRINLPTLVMHQLADEPAAEIARPLAASIASARILGIPGDLISGYPNSVGIAAILDFITAEPAASGKLGPVPELNLGAIRNILWTDIVGHTPLMERLGDAKGREVLREHERLTREALAAHGGPEVKAMGDGFMAWFSSAQRALECAIALQRAFAAYNASAAEPLGVRVGVNAGEPIAEEDDLFGTSVITAARICAQAAGGEIVASDVVRQLVAGKGFSFADRGAVPLKGFEEPVRIFEVSWRE